MTTRVDINEFMDSLRGKNPGQNPYIQAVREVVTSLIPVFKEDDENWKYFKYMSIPEQLVKFRVPWVDDKGELQCNTGYRIQYSSALGPYKGGLRFHPTVNEGILKFLAFEQIFKNSLTGLQIGGGKGGSDFNPKGKSDNEVMRFCQSFMTELFKYIGPTTDVPAGDIGVGGREIGYLFGQYKRLTRDYSGVLTGKGTLWGGSLIRPEATGYGCVYFAREALRRNKIDINGKICVVSGSGNVAQYTVEKLLELGAKVLTMSDSGGYIYDEEGIDRNKLNFIMNLKNVKRGRIREYVDKFPSASYVSGKKPWTVKCDLAFPSATQNEISEDQALALVSNGCIGVFEGANMPSTEEAIHHFETNGVIFGPGKAANAGGVAVSSLEMSQNASMTRWSRQKVDQELQDIMVNICKQAYDAKDKYGGTIKDGANVAGFLRVKQAMKEQGYV